MILGVGIDHVGIERFARMMERHGKRARARLFTARELARADASPQPLLHLAARFAAKEAGMKALGTGWSGGISFTDFEVVNDGSGAPSLVLHAIGLDVARKLGVTQALVSLSHTDQAAMAVVLLQGPDSTPAG